MSHSIKALLWGKKKKKKRNQDFSRKASFSLEKVLKLGARATKFEEITCLDFDRFHSAVKTGSVLQKKGGSVLKSLQFKFRQPQLDMSEGTAWGD